MLAPHAKRGRLSLTLVDKENSFQFNPLPPEVATGAVETRHIVYPLRSSCAPRGVRFLRNKVRRVDHERRVLVLHNALEVPYDHLVIAAGSTTNYFGIPGAADLAFPFKTRMDAIRLRAHVVEMWELADQATDPAVRRQLLTFVVAGGVITGVEVCSSYMEMFRRTMARLYTQVPHSLVTVHLVEAGERLLGGGARRAQGHRRAPPAHAGGERGAQLQGGEGRARLRHPRRRERHPRPHPGVDHRGARPGAGEPLALPPGRNGKLKVDVHGQSAEMRYTDIGYLVGLGRHSTVGRIFGIPVSGLVAWYVWAFAYLFKMVGLRKQLEVATDIVKSWFVDHDTSQIHERRRMLREVDLDPELGRTA